MAKSDSDSNGLRQDQPEWVSPIVGEGCGGISLLERGRSPYIIAWSRSGSGRPDRCHRTTKANIRFHLYGGPQGWNPHFVSDSVETAYGDKPVESVSPRGVNRRGGRRASADGVQPSAVALCSSHYCLRRGLYLTSLISDDLRKYV